MRRIRVIPVLLLDQGKLVKTRAFKNPKYVGDPINAIRIFNEKGVDELVVCDISKDRLSRGPDFNLLKKLASEAFMPMAYAGGVSTVNHGSELVQIGFEKIGLNSILRKDPELIGELSDQFGAQSVVASVDYRKNWFSGERQYVNSGKSALNGKLVDQVRRWVDLGAGEVWLNDFGREGSYSGYDCDVISRIAQEVPVPIVALGGCGEVAHIREVVKVGAAAAAAGAMFVYQRPHEAVLISYLKNEIILD